MSEKGSQLKTVLAMLSRYARAAIVWNVVLVGLALNVLISATAAADGFVVEAVNASPDVSTRFSNETILEIEDDGYIVLMSDWGGIVRRDGPYSDTAEKLFDFPRDNEPEPLVSALIASLLALAEVSRKSEESISGVRGNDSEVEFDGGAISATTSVFCLEAGTLPEFYVSQPPTTDEVFTLRRLSESAQTFSMTWPAGMTLVPWSEQWPSPDRGKYFWRLGQRPQSPLRIEVIRDLPQALPERAALFFDLGCDAQAIALFRELVANADQR